MTIRGSTASYEDIAETIVRPYTRCRAKEEYIMTPQGWAVGCQQQYVGLSGIM